MEQVKKAAIVLAAGHGKRMHSKVAKQYLLLNGEPVLVHALRAFEMSGMDTIILVTGADEVEFCRKDIVEAYGFSSVKQVVPGGNERYDSVWNGLCALKAAGFPEDGIVLIHDGARPLVDGEIIARAVDGACSYSACVAAMPAKDTIKVADADGFSESTPDRSTLYAVQTPQCFDRAAYLAALEELDEEKARLVTDDCSLFELTGRPVQLTQGDYANLKITTREDLPRPAQRKETEMRIGHGYDVHRLVEQRKLILGGVEIPFEKGLLGHSDADVLTHAVMDAVLGAAALGDIGQHFPDNDPEYAGADSLKLACRVAQILKEHGWRIENIDATLLCQRPKLAPHIPAMRANLAAAFGLPVEAVSVKATTEEHLGFTGEGLGIAAHAVALIEAV